MYNYSNYTIVWCIIIIIIVSNLLLLYLTHAQMDVAESQFNRTMYRYGNNTATNEIVNFYQTLVCVCVEVMGVSPSSMYLAIGI